MRALFSGSLSFGLINIPVNLYSGINERGGINLDMLHKKDLSPIRYAKICKAEEKEIPYEEVVKGYEVQDGEYVVITDEDFAKIYPKRTKTIEIHYFIKEEEVNSVYFEKPYFLEPGKGTPKAYFLLADALKKSKKVGVVTYVIHTREHIGIVKPYGRGIILNQLRYESELRNFNEIELPIAKIDPKEMEMAMKLINQLTEKFKPEKFKDNYAEMIQAIIDEKTKGKKIKAKKKEAPLTGVHDLMGKLKESLKSYSHPVKKALSARKR